MEEGRAENRQYNRLGPGVGGAGERGDGDGGGGGWGWKSYRFLHIM